MNAVTIDDSPPTPRSFRRLEGARILAGRWVLGRLIGEGGAAMVYQARSREDRERRVAVKLLLPAVAGDPFSRSRFVREAYIANQIDHPGVVRILEDGEDDAGTPFIVMELLRGETLDARARRKGGKLPLSEVLWIADRLLDVLAAAHARGIVHRDIKPENLFLTENRELKVLHFGIARLADASHAATMAGTILGTLAYMPPEQARGSVTEVGAASDLWSVGATMFTLLSGQYVRDDGDVAAMLLEAGNTAVRSLAQVAPELPREVIDLVDFALSHERGVRWPSALMMRRAVRAAHERVAFRKTAPSAPEGDEWEAADPSFGAVSRRSRLAPPPVSLLPAPTPAAVESVTRVGLAETLPVNGAPPVHRTLQSPAKPRRGCNPRPKSSPWIFRNRMSSGISAHTRVAGSPPFPATTPSTS